MTGGMGLFMTKKIIFENFANPSSIIWQPIETDYWKKYLKENLIEFLPKQIQKLQKNFVKL